VGRREGQVKELGRDSVSAAKVALVVGPCLVAINHFDELADARWSWGLGLKALLTFLVPFLVSLHGARSARCAEPDR
jgi:hypothetical protein